MAQDVKRHNWPTWPAPCTRYAPDEDIVGPESESRRDWVKYLYYLWFGNVLGLFWNFCSMCAYVDSEGSDIALVFLALVYFIAGAPGAFFGWMKLGYRAAETSSNFQYLMFLIWFGLCGLFWIGVAIGFPEAGMAGMIAMIAVWDDSDAAGTMCLVGFILYVSLALLHLWLWYRGSRLFSESGGVEKAKQDAEKEGGKQFVQHAVGAMDSVSGSSFNISLSSNFVMCGLSMCAAPGLLFCFRRKQPTRQSKSTASGPPCVWHWRTPAFTGDSMVPVDYFEIPVSRLQELGHQVLIYYMPSYTLSSKLRIVWNVVCFRLGLTALLLQSEYEWLEFDNWRSFDEMPAETVRHYTEWGNELQAGASPQVLSYIGVPHVFVKGAIPVEGLRVIRTICATHPFKSK